MDINDKFENMPVLAIFFLILADFIAYFYLFLKIYRVLCFSKITFDQLPMLNPYKWPLSLIRVTTMPYFRFWGKVLPNLRFGKGAYDVSTILALEMLSCVISICANARGFSLEEAQRVLTDYTS
jgi:hypothetical protein